MAWLKEGTVSVTLNSNVATFAGTNLLTYEVVPGMALLLDASGERPYEIIDIISATQATIYPPYKAATKTGQTFTVIPVLGVARALYSTLRSVMDFMAGLTAGAISNGLVVLVGGLTKFQVDAEGAIINGLLTGTAVTQSVIDKTLGRLLKVGDHGRHGKPIQLVSTDNLNGMFDEGIYYWSTGDAPIGAPTTEAGMVAIWSRSSSTAQQVAWRTSISSGAQESYFRNVSSSGVSRWSENIASVTSPGAAVINDMAVVGGTSSAMTLTTRARFTTENQIPDGMAIRFRPDVAIVPNAGSVGFAVDGLTARAGRVYGTSATALPANFFTAADITAGVVYEAIWRSSTLNWMIRKVT